MVLVDIGPFFANPSQSIGVSNFSLLVKSKAAKEIDTLRSSAFNFNVLSKIDDEIESLSFLRYQLL